MIFATLLHSNFFVLSISHFLFLGLFFYSVMANAQQDCQGGIKGKITDQDQKYLVGVSVQIKNTKFSVLSDSLGNYQFKNVCSGPYLLIYSSLGKILASKTIVVTHQHEANISLKTANIALQDLVITGQKLENTTLNKNTITGQALASTRGLSLAESLKDITGVTSLQTGSSIAKPVIHGLHSSRILILNNGIRQEGQQWGAEHAPEIDPFVANQLTVLKGPSGIRYGSDAIGGIILVEQAPLKDTPEIHGEANAVGFMNGKQGILSTMLERGLGKGLAIRLQGTAKRGGDVKTSNYFLQNTGLAEYNFMAMASLKHERFKGEVLYSQFNTQLGIFTGSHIGNTTDLQLAIDRGTPLAIYTPNQGRFGIERPYQDIRHNLLKIKGVISLKNEHKLALTLAKQYNYRAEYDITRNNQGASQGFELDTYTTEIVFEHAPIRQKLSGTIGLSTLYQANVSTGKLGQPLIKTVLIPNFENLNLGIFWIEKYVAPRWEAALGLRYDSRSLRAFQKTNALQSNTEVSINQKINHHASASFGLAYLPSQNLNFKLNTAMAWRPANVHELFADGVHHGAAAYELGNENLSPETAYNISLDTEYQLNKHIFKVSFYQNYIQNFLYLQAQNNYKLTIRGAFPSFAYIQNNAVFRGFDFESQHQITKRFSVHNKFAFLYVRDTDTQQYLVNIPANRLEHLLKYTFFKDKSFVQMGYLHVFEQKNIEKNSDFAPPPPAYSLFSLQVGYSHKNNTWHLGISNLFNQSYREYLNRQRYFADDLGRNLSIRFQKKF